MPTAKTTVKLPPNAGAKQETTAYVLRIELRELDPAIWREVWVDPAMTLRKLHGVIQAAMGWHNCHMYGFGIPGTGRAADYWGVPSLRRYEPRKARDAIGPDEAANDDARTQLRQVMAAPKDKLLYMYDFGDDWEHLITLKKIVTTSEPLPRLTEAAFSCPPEDCGGPGGFIHLAEVLSDPRDPEHPELRDWADETMGADWTPGDLDTAGFEERASAVAKLRAHAKARKKGA